MTRRRAWAGRVLVPLAIAPVLLGPAIPAMASAVPGGARHGRQDAQRVVTVMTQNLDRGTNFTPLITAANEPDFLSAATAIFDAVVESDVQGRARLVAREITAAAPDVVSLQEVSLWTWQSATGPASIDALGALDRALADEGAHYAPALVLDEFAGAAPVEGFGQVSFTDRDVLLVRTDQPASRLRVSNVQGGHYAKMLSIPTAAGMVTIPRGWIAADVAVQGRAVRVVTTHLEGLSPVIQQAQGRELVAGLTGAPLPVIIAGDLNTGPLAAGGYLTPTYQQILASGYTDTWPVTNPGAPGLTGAFHTEDPYGPAEPDKRTDLVLVTGNLRPVSATLTGTSAVDRLWPSDHAGVVARIQIPS
jgi:endonuclease/exonuclease/phosphatase family metal-dependent hydrolase